MQNISQNTMENILIKFKTGHKTRELIPITDFLNTDESALSNEDIRKKAAIVKLYELNEKEHLFDRFNPPPIFDLTTKISEEDKKRGKGGNYNPETNTLIVEEEQSTDLTAATIAHELEHAKQMKGDMYQIATGKKKISGKEKLQLKFLTEAQAFALGSYVYYKASGGDAHFMGKGDYYEQHKESFAPVEKILASHKNSSYKNIEGELIKAWLDILYKGETSTYRNRFIEGTSLSAKDKNLDKIPTSFQLSESVSQKILEKLEEVPTTTTVEERLTKATSQPMITASYIKTTQGEL